MPERSENPNQPPAEHCPNQERELSPEQIEKIMEKVQDLQMQGIAFSALIPDINVPDSPYREAVVRRKYIDNLKTVLQSGLIQRGSTVGANSEEIHEQRKKRYVFSLRKKRQAPFVYFNITGRMHDSRVGIYTQKMIEENDFQTAKPVEISASEYGSYPIIMLFDLQGFQESIDQRHGEALPLGTYQPNHPDIRDSKDGKTTVDSEFGFVLGGRVAPRKFTGILLHPTKYGRHLKDYYLIDEWLRGIKEINDTLPVYDCFGNLLWPKEMSYEEVKQFVAEREAKKKETEENNHA